MTETVIWTHERWLINIKMLWCYDEKHSIHTKHSTAFVFNESNEIESQDESNEIACVFKANVIWRGIPDVPAIWLIIHSHTHTNCICLVLNVWMLIWLSSSIIRIIIVGIERNHRNWPQKPAPNVTFMLLQFVSAIVKYMQTIWCLLDNLASLIWNFSVAD